MHSHYVPASYLASFLRIKINVEADFKNLRHLPDEVKALFFHEYTHFIQNLTTQYGLTTLWNTFDRIRHIIAIAQEKTNELKLPLNDPRLEKEYNHLEIIKTIKGDFNIPNTNWENGTHKVVKVKFESNPLLKILHPDQDIPIVKLTLENNF